MSLALLAPAASAAVFVPGGSEPDPPTGDQLPPPQQASEPLRAPGFQWVLAPWRRAGSLSVDGRWLWLDSGRSSRQGLVLAEMEWASHLWQPWFLQLNLGLGLLASRDAANGPDTNGGSASGSGSGITGRLSLALFPASRFPFEFRADLGDSRTGGDSLGAELRSQRYSLSQSYRPETGNRHYHLQLEHSRLQAADSRDTLSTLQLGGQHQLGAHQLDLGGNVSVNLRSDRGERSQLASLNARHGFHPRPELQLDTSANWNQTRLRSAAGQPLQQELGSEVRQITTVLSWRPREGDVLHDAHRPLQVAGSARWVDVRTLGSGLGQRAQAYAATLGANLDLATAWRVSGALSASRLHTGNGAAVSTAGLNGSVGWTPQGTLLDRWRYTPSAAMNLGLSRSDGSPQRRLLGLQGTHSLSRDWTPGDGQQLALTLSQSAAVLGESGTPALARALAHSLGLFWQASGDSSRQRFVGLSISDSITRAAGDGRFQLVNLQLNQRTQLSRLSGWSVNLTLQATRNESSEIDVFSGERRQHGGGWQRFYSGGASFDQQRLFGVPRLRHSLQLSLNSQQIERRAAGDIDAPRERITQSLESRVDYAIGRLDLRLSLRHAKVDGRAVTALNARLQRRF